MGGGPASVQIEAQAYAAASPSASSSHAFVLRFDAWNTLERGKCILGHVLRREQRVQRANAAYGSEKASSAASNISALTALPPVQLHFSRTA